MIASGKIPVFKCGAFSRYNNIDGTTSCYRNMNFIGAFENTYAFCDLYSSLSTEIEQKDQRIKELEEALSFTVNALSNFFPFCGHGSIDSLPRNLDATQYQTCSYDGDKSLLEKYIKCRELIKREVE